MIVLPCKNVARILNTGKNNLINNVSGKLPLNFTIAIYLGLILNPGLLLADSLEFVPTLTLEERYTDNVNLASSSPESVTETLLRANLSLSRLTETSVIQGRLHSTFSSYAKNQQYATFMGEKRAQLSKWKLNGLFRRDTTIRTISQDTDTVTDSDLSEDIDTGFIQREIRRNTLRLMPAWNYSSNVRTNWGLRYKLTDVSYDNNIVGSGLFDYQVNGIEGASTYNLDENSSINTVIGYSEYDSDGSDTSVQSYTLAIAYNGRFSERTTIGANLGFRRSDSKSGESNTEKNGYLLGMRMTHLTEFGKIKIIADHDLQPSGSGSLVETNRLDINIQRKFLVRMFAHVRIRGFEKKSIDSSNNFTRYFVSVSPRVSWKLTRWWSLGAGVQYRIREYLDSNNDADSHSIFISLRYSKKATVDFL